ncbi:hypothetical protein E4U59_005188 [Claviceps monticola]|nr:hypothetical protein E4U59_005188 [Claviceps monticola]
MIKLRQRSLIVEAWEISKTEHGLVLLTNRRIRQTGSLVIQALRREVNNKQKYSELETSILENVNQQGRETSSLSEEDLERIHPSGAFYPVHMMNEIP